MSRKATGLKRKIQIPVFFDEEEAEFMARESHYLEKSKTELLRIRFLGRGWRRRLENYRNLQQKDWKNLSLRSRLKLHDISFR